jgi:hypothetical protein
MEINKELEEIPEKAKEYIKETYKRSWEDHGTSQKRFDYLIVTVSGTGIYLSLELMKFLYENKLPITASLKLSGIFLAISIILNFFAQFFTFNVFNSVLKLEQIDALDLKKDKSIVLKRIRIYNQLGQIFMFLSILFMMIGIVGLIIFLFKSF